MSEPGPIADRTVRTLPLAVLAAIAICGWVGGNGLHRWLGGDRSPSLASADNHPTPAAQQDPAAFSAARAALDQLATLKSTDSLDDLLALEEHELFPHLALWVLDASTADLARYWSAFRANKTPDDGVARLVFTQWMRLDPEGAWQAVGRECPVYVWLGWALNDPTTALARMAELDPGHLAIVLQVIGQSHPELAAKVAAEHPEFLHCESIGGLADGLTCDDPAATIKLLRQFGQTDTSKLIREWTREDPQAAAAWIQQQFPGSQAAIQLTCLIDTLERENPAALQDLANAQAPGKVRRQMEAALFRSLLVSDPAAALQQARTTESPVLAAERLAEAGRALATKDPEQSFTLFAELLEKCPTALYHRNFTEYPNGSGGNLDPLPGVMDLANSLLGSDPRRAMAIATVTNESESSEGPARALAAAWSQRDFDGFCVWLDEQPTGKARDAHLNTAVNRLNERQSFQEAAQWAASAQDEYLRGSMFEYVARSWARHDRAAAVEWFDKAELPDPLRQKLSKQLQEAP
jgi:hypothetical protein